MEEASRCDSKDIDRRSVSPAASSDFARTRMQRQLRRDTGPETELRRHLHHLGLRYRIDVAPLPGLRGRADIVFPRARVAVFVDGCFWHGCPEHGTWPKANAEWWREKIERNQRRDVEMTCLLREAGWTVMRVWEHEDFDEAACRIAEVVRGRVAVSEQAP